MKVVDINSDDMDEQGGEVTSSFKKHLLAITLSIEILIILMNLYFIKVAADFADQINQDEENEQFYKEKIEK